MIILNNKKAISITLTIAELLVIIAVAFGTLSIAKDRASSDTVEKIIISEDVASMIHVLVAVPGDAVVQYPGNMKEYTIILDKETLSVFKTVDGNPEPKRFWAKKKLFLPDGYEVLGIVKQSRDMYIKKENKKITLTDKNE